MKIALVSDLHQDTRNNWYDHKPLAADVVVVAGDLAAGNNVRDLVPYKSNSEVIYIPGNHEYYDFEFLQTRSNLLTTGVNLGINVLDKHSVIIDNVKFLGCTLWTDFNLYGIENRFACMDVAKKCLNDYHHIIYGKTILKPQDTANFFAVDSYWLENQLSVPYNGKTVVITHTAPSSKSVHPKYGKDLLNACFASNLENMIMKYQPSLWLHGHTHSPFDYMIGNIRVVCNPRGYNGENINYEPKILEI